jgi:hypothetical protein
MLFFFVVYVSTAPVIFETKWHGYKIRNKMFSMILFFVYYVSLFRFKASSDGWLDILV